MGRVRFIGGPTISYRETRVITLFWGGLDGAANDLRPRLHSKGVNHEEHEANEGLRVGVWRHGEHRQSVYH